MCPAQAESTKWSGLKYRQLYVQGFTVGSTDYFNAYWELRAADTQQWYSRHNLSPSEYQVRACVGGFRVRV